MGVIFIVLTQLQSPEGQAQVEPQLQEQSGAVWPLNQCDPHREIRR